MKDPKNLLLPEERLLLSLCRLDFTEGQKSETEGLIRNISDWGRFVRLANIHGIIALCWYNLNRVFKGKGIPTDTLSLLQKAYLKSLAKNTALYKQLDDIALLAESKNIILVLLKGIVLEKTIYGNKGLRQMSDIDLLVEMDHAVDLRNLLLENGYLSYPLISPLHEKILPGLKSHLPVMEKNGILTEIHVRLFDQEGNSLTEEIIRKAIPAGLNSGILRCPPEQLHFLYLIKHLERHSRTKDLKLKQYTDLALLLTREQEIILDRQLFKLAEEVNIADALKETLIVLRTFWDINYTELVNELIKSINPERIIMRFCDFLHNPERYKKEGSIYSFVKPLKELHGLVNKLLFIIGYLFPSLTYVKYKYKKNSNVRALLYYPVRWKNIFKRISG